MIITGKYPELRLRRTRQYDWSRRLVKENSLSANDLVQPIFLVDGKNKRIPVKSMPNVFRYSIDRISQEVDKSVSNKIPMISLFPFTNHKLKNNLGTEALNENNLVCKAIKLIKKRYKNSIGIMCDVALDPYTSHGHDGIINENKIAVATRFKYKDSMEQKPDEINCYVDFLRDDLATLELGTKYNPLPNGVSQVYYEKLNASEDDFKKLRNYCNFDG